MAAGSTIALFDAVSGRPPSSTYPQIDFRNGHVVLDFDDASDEATYFAGVLPSTYNGGGLSAVVTFAASSATTGNIVWAIAFERIEPGVSDLDADGFGTESSAAASVDSTAGVTRQMTLALAVSDMDNAQAGDLFRVRLRRIATDTSDTAPGDAEFVSLELQEG